MNDEQIHTGTHGSYYWLTSIESYSGTILQICPELFVHRYVAVTPVDGGVMQLTDEQRVTGWEIRRGIGYSPKLAEVVGCAASA